MTSSDLVREAKQSTREEFAKSHPGFFLVPAPRIVRARAQAPTVPASRAALFRQSTGALEEGENAAPLKVAALRPKSETAPVHVGRTDENDVVIVDATVSRRHAAFVIAGDRVEVVDLGSRNGTRVRGIQLRAGESQAVKSGDPIDIGSVHLILVDAQACWNALQER
jgi:pSer/pThr/pTyr-binding forkhead associated (FHA) protein